MKDSETPRKQVEKNPRNSEQDLSNGFAFTLGSDQLTNGRLINFAFFFSFESGLFFNVGLVQVAAGASSLSEKCILYFFDVHGILISTHI